MSIEDHQVRTTHELREKLLRVFRDPKYVPPVLPRIAVELLALSSKPDVNIREVVALLENDALIAARVLKQAQSPVYSRGSPVRSLHEAIVRLGLGTIRDLFLAASIEARMFRTPVYDETMDRLRRHSAAAAHVTRLVCRTRAFDVQHAFVCGLLHDCGIAAGLIALAGSVPRGQSAPDLHLVWDSLCELHSEAGELLCRLWNLPPEIAVVVGAHHGPREGRAHPLSAAIAVAEAILGELDLALPGDEPRGSASWALAMLGLGERDVAALVPEARAHLAACGVAGVTADPAPQAPRPDADKVPPSSDPVWRNLLTGSVAPTFAFLPHKLALGKLSAHVARDPSALFEAARELRGLFVDTARNPVAARDLALLAHPRSR